MIKNDIWDIRNRQQTQIKLDILKKYLWSWAIIIGDYFSEAYFVDCFAGRGKYHNGDQFNSVSGSPLIGVETSLAVKRTKLKKYLNFNLNIIVVETNKDNLKDLRKFIADVNPDLETKVEIYDKEFDIVLPEIIDKTSDVPAFFFIDPYGIKGISKNCIDLIINRVGHTEIFLNYMKMGIQRVKGQHKNINHENKKIQVMAVKTVAHMDSLFGDKSWIEKEEDELLKHFAQQVFSKNYKFVLNFNVPYPDRAGTMYNLIFATNNNSAEKIMKSIMTQKLFKGTLFENCPFNVDWSIK